MNQSASPGPLLIIGGAEDKLGQRSILTRFVSLAGKASARIVVISTASALGDSATEAYRGIFNEMGVTDISGLRPETRRDANDPAGAEALEDATGLFLTGGNQLKLSTVTAGTRLGKAIAELHERGGVIGGTSAGASALSSHMVSGGSSGDIPKHRMGQLSAGLGLLKDVIVDQHFGERNRIGRLIALVAQSPSHLGMGIDEDTAALVKDDVLEVIGKGAIVIVDGHDLESNAHEVKGTKPIMVSGAVLHCLTPGFRFDLKERRLLPQLRAVGVVPPVGSKKDLIRQLAAEGADDRVVVRNARRRARRRSAE